MSLELKKKVIDHTLGRLKEKHRDLKIEMEKLVASSAEETKSSMGDKYETGRAMVMQEQEKIADRIDQVQDQMNRLLAIDVNKIFQEVQFGALVITDKAYFLVSISHGLVQLDQTPVFLVSPTAPVAQAMLGKEVKSSFSVNKLTHLIRAIY